MSGYDLNKLEHAGYRLAKKPLDEVLDQMQEGCCWIEAHQFMEVFGESWPAIIHDLKMLQANTGYQRSN